MKYKIDKQDKILFISLLIIFFIGAFTHDQIVISTSVLGLIMMSLYVSIMEKLSDIHDLQTKK